MIAEEFHCQQDAGEAGAVQADTQLPVKGQSHGSIAGIAWCVGCGMKCNKNAF